MKVLVQFTAALRLPGHLSTADRTAAVDAIIDMLALHHCQDTGGQSTGYCCAEYSTLVLRHCQDTGAQSTEYWTCTSVPLPGVTGCNLSVVLYLCRITRMCQCWPHAVLWSYIDMLRLLLATELRRTTVLFFIPLSVSLWKSNDLCDPVFDSVGLAGLKSRVNSSL